MFIALQKPIPLSSSGALCALGRPGYIPLLAERDGSGIWGYKHVAPPEQEPSIPMMTTFGQSRLNSKLRHKLRRVYNEQFNLNLATEHVDETYARESEP